MCVSLGSCHVVVLVVWHTKYGLPSDVARSSHPVGNGRLVTACCTGTVTTEAGGGLVQDVVLVAWST